MVRSVRSRIIDVNQDPDQRVHHHKKKHRTVRPSLLLHLPDLKNAAMSAASLDVSSPSPELILGSMILLNKTPQTNGSVSIFRDQVTDRE